MVRCETSHRPVHCHTDWWPDMQIRSRPVPLLYWLIFTINIFLIYISGLLEFLPRSVIFTLEKVCLFIVWDVLTQISEWGPELRVWETEGGDLGDVDEMSHGGHSWGQLHHPGPGSVWPVSASQWGHQVTFENFGYWKLKTRYGGWCTSWRPAAAWCWQWGRPAVWRAASGGQAGPSSFSWQRRSSTSARKLSRSISRS